MACDHFLLEILSTLNYLTLILWFSSYFFGLTSVSSATPPPDQGLPTLIKRIAMVPVVLVNIYLLMPPKSIPLVQLSLMSFRPIGKVSQLFPWSLQFLTFSVLKLYYWTCPSPKPTPLPIFPFSVNGNSIHPETRRSSSLDFSPFPLSWIITTTF